MERGKTIATAAGGVVILNTSVLAQTGKQTGLPPSQDPGPLERAFGPKTKPALMSFQKAEKLLASSRGDRQTLAKLGAQSIRATRTRADARVAAQRRMP